MDYSPLSYGFSLLSTYMDYSHLNYAIMEIYLSLY